MTVGHALVPGDTLDARYRIIRPLARGGFGAVLEAEQIYTGRRVAIKHVQSPEAIAVSTAEVFLREARALARIDHRGVVRVLDAAHDPRHGLYLVLELLEGESLESLLARRGPFSVAQLAFIGRQLCGALAAIHERGVIHRDLKPSNVMVVRTGTGEQIKLVDFGIAQIDALVPGVLSPRAGTPMYMSSEQLRSAPHIDAQTDLYALGVILFECLVGEVPFHGEIQDLIDQQGKGLAPHRLRVRPDVTDALIDVITRALSPDPARRFQSAQHFDHAVMEATAPSRRRERLLTANPRPVERPVTVSHDHDEDLATARLRAPSRHTPTDRYDDVASARASRVSFRRADGTTTVRVDRITPTSLTGVAEGRVPSGECGTLEFIAPAGDVIAITAEVAWVEPSAPGAANTDAHTVAFVFHDVVPNARRLLQQYFGPPAPTS